MEENCITVVHAIGCFLPCARSVVVSSSHGSSSFRSRLIIAWHALPPCFVIPHNQLINQSMFLLSERLSSSFCLDSDLSNSMQMKMLLVFISLLFSNPTIVRSGEMAPPTASAPSLAAPQSNPLSKKISKILETKLDQNRELLEPLRGLSDFYGANTSEARRNLRSRVERRNVEMNQDFVNMLDGLNRKVRLSKRGLALLDGLNRKVRLGTRGLALLASRVVRGLGI